MHSPLKIGLIGGGTMAAIHAAAWRAADADLFISGSARARLLAREFGATSVETTADLLPQVDAVDICTPTSSHHPLALQALSAGLHVLCEKPLARTAEKARELIAMAKEHDRVLFPAHVVRYFPEYVETKRAVDSGRIGKPAILKFSRTGAFPASPWYADDEESGGIVLDQMIHDIDQALWLAGPVETVYGVEQRATVGGGVRTAHALLTHASGAITHCRSLWGAEATSFSYSFDIAGTSGVIRHDSRASRGYRMQPTIERSGIEAGGYVPSITSGASPYLQEIEDFIRAMRSGTTPRATADDGHRAVEICLAIIDSITSGAAVEIEHRSE